MVRSRRWIACWNCCLSTCGRSAVLRPRAGLSPSRSLSDLIQETLVRVRISFNRFERDTVSDLQQWTRTILYRRWQHLVRNYSVRNQELRKERIFLAIRARVVDQADSLQPEEVLEKREEARRIYNIYKSQCERMKQFIIELRLFKGLKYKDIAKVGRITDRGGREKAYARAIDRLRQLCHATERTDAIEKDEPAPSLDDLVAADRREGSGTLALLIGLARLVEGQDFETGAYPNDLTFADWPPVRDRYQLEALLGAGGHGAVFRARDLRLGCCVALKLAWPGVLLDPDASRRFVEEPKLVAALTSSRSRESLRFRRCGDGLLHRTGTY